MNYGHVKLSRKLFDGHDPLWSRRRVYSPAEAWIDVLVQAAWHTTTYRSPHGDDLLTRGEFLASTRYLASRWRWSKSRVNRFLKWCEKADRIAGQRVGQHGAIYLIVNYDTYQTSNSTSGTPDGTLSGTKTKAVKALTTRTRVSDGSRPAPRQPQNRAAFDELVAAYPRGDGSDNYELALPVWRALLKKGVNPAEIVAGAKRYDAHIRARGDVGTRYVKALRRFLGRDRAWKDPWPVVPAAGGAVVGPRDVDGTPLAGPSAAAAMRTQEAALMAARAHSNGPSPA